MKRRPANPPVSAGGDMRLQRRDVVVVRRPDPDRPALDVIGGRVSTTLTRLARDGELEAWQLAAGERFRHLWEVVEIGRTPDASGVHRAAWERAGASEAVMAALAEWRSAEERLGGTGRDVIRLVVCAGCTLADAHRRLWPASKVSRQQGAAVVKGMLMLALTQLAEGWRMTPTQQARMRSAAL